ncbi:MAG: M23 family metallopeptidase [Bacilli bacterium]|nr:M23 family metallopeptidase [Bacilli bacterium]
MLIALLPVVGIIMIILIILAILAALLGSDTAFYQSFFVLPFDCNTYSITSDYGERIDPISYEISFHNGIDVVPTSSNIVAIADGIVVASEVQDMGGESVIIEHKISGQVYRSSYHHLKENSRVVNVGDQVKQGQQVGIMGSTGYVTGTHLHFSLQKFNTKEQKFEYTDPTIVIKNKISAKEYNLFDYSTKNENLDNERYPILTPPEKPVIPSIGP